jgi:hypothetical protein
VHCSLASDRYIFTGNEALIRQAKPKLVVFFAFRVVEVPLTALLSPQTAYANIRVTGKTPDPTCRLIGLPDCRIEPAVFIEWDEKVISFASFALRMASLAGKQESDVAESRRQIVRQHGDIPFENKKYTPVHATSLMKVKYECRYDEDGVGERLDMFGVFERAGKLSLQPPELMRVPRRPATISTASSSLPIAAG